MLKKFIHGKDNTFLYKKIADSIWTVHHPTEAPYCNHDLNEGELEELANQKFLSSPCPKCPSIYHKWKVVEGPVKIKKGKAEISKEEEEALMKYTKATQGLYKSDPPKPVYAKKFLEALDELWKLSLRGIGEREIMDTDDDDDDEEGFKNKDFYGQKVRSGSEGSVIFVDKEPHKYVVKRSFMHEGYIINGNLSIAQENNNKAHDLDLAPEIYETLVVDSEREKTERVVYELMEFSPGTTLLDYDIANFLNKYDETDEFAAWDKIFDNLFKALKELNDIGVHHSDLGPGNIIISKIKEGEYKVRLIDFSHSSFAIFSEPIEFFGDRTYEKYKANVNTRFVCDKIFRMISDHISLLTYFRPRQRVKQGLNGYFTSKSKTFNSTEGFYQNKDTFLLWKIVSEILSIYKEFKEEMDNPLYTVAMDDSFIMSVFLKQFFHANVALGELFKPSTFFDSSYKDIDLFPRVYKKDPTTFLEMMTKRRTFTEMKSEENDTMLRFIRLSFLALPKTTASQIGGLPANVLSWNEYLKKVTGLRTFY